MSVDKFGRYDQVGKKPSSDLQDIASNAFVNNNCLLLSQTKNCYDAKNRCVSNVSLPSHQNDAANKQYVQNYSLGRTSDLQYSAGNKFIRDLRDPILPTDAANMRFVKEHSLKRTNPDRHVDLEGKLLKNLASPSDPSDAATMSFVTEHSLKRTHPDGHIDLEGKLLRNLASPSLPTDAVNLEYLSKNTPTMKNTHWIFHNKKLSNVHDPQFEGEVVNLRTLRKFLRWSVHHHSAQIKRLSSALFDYIHRTSGNSPELGVTNTDYLNMEGILNLEMLREVSGEEGEDSGGTIKKNLDTQN